MSKCTEIREICGDWAFDIVYNDGELLELCKGLLIVTEDDDETDI